MAQFAKNVMTESSTRVAVFDTSALIKHYHDEPGTEVVDLAFDDLSKSRIITDITLIEFHSAFARRVLWAKLRLKIIATPRQSWSSMYGKAGCWRGAANQRLTGQRPHWIPGR